MNKPLSVAICSGQLYLHHGWRIRYNDMSERMKQMVVSLGDPKSQVDLQAAFETYYSAQKMENELYNIIGPARKEGTQCLLRHAHLL